MLSIENRVDPDQLASEEDSLSGFTLFLKYSTTCEFDN